MYKEFKNDDFKSGNRRQKAKYKLFPFCFE